MQKFWKAIALVLMLSFVAACGRTAGEWSRVGGEAETAAVLSALIEGELANPLSFFNLDETLLIVSRTYDTTDYAAYEHIRDDELYAAAPALDKDTVHNFRALNREYQTLDLPLSIGKPYAYVAEPLSYEDWLALDQKYPDAMVYIIFSRVGFNQEMDQALVYMAHRCGDECGHGAVYFLVRKDGAWQVENEIEAWVS